MPEICHSFVSRYAVIASAARNERERPVLLASFSSLLLVERSTRTENVSVFICKQYITPHDLCIGNGGDRMPERRTDERRRVLKAGKFVWNEGGSVLDCTLRNVSKTGALLGVVNAVAVPEKFELHWGGTTRAFWACESCDKWATPSKNSVLSRRSESRLPRLRKADSLCSRDRSTTVLAGETRTRGLLRERPRAYGEYGQRPASCCPHGTMKSFPP
jgi:hypothetical protein